MDDKLSLACSVQREVVEEDADADGGEEAPAAGGVSYVVTAGASYEISKQVIGRCRWAQRRPRY